MRGCMVDSQVHKLLINGDGWEGNCPVCNRRLKFPKLMYDSSCFTGEIVCGGAGCYTRFNAEVGEHHDQVISTILLSPVYAPPETELVAPARTLPDPKASRFSDKIAAVERQLEECAAGCEELFGKMKEHQAETQQQARLALEKTEQTIAALARGVESNCSAIDSQIKSTDK